MCNLSHATNRVLTWLYPFAYFEHMYKPVVAKYLDKMLYSSCKNNNNKIANINFTAFAICHLLTIVKLVWMDCLAVCGAQLI